MRTHSVIALLIGLVAGALLAGCMTPPDDAGLTDSDRQLARDIVSRLAQDPVTAGLSFGVEAANGVVTLEGTVPTEEARLRALAIARGTSDEVLDVVDRLYRVDKLNRW
jgi:osmotically-inducible protein OsmY